MSQAPGFAPSLRWPLEITHNCGRKCPKPVVDVQLRVVSGETCPTRVRGVIEVVGLTARGWEELPERLRVVVREAEVMLGSPRLLDLVPPADSDQQLLTWPSPMSAEQALARIRECATLQQERRAINFAILLRDSGELIGWVGVKLRADGPPRLGYWIGTDFRNAGLMKEAAQCAVPAGAAFLEADAVDALVLPENAASIAVLRAAGFTHVPDAGLDFTMTGGVRHSERYRWEARLT